MVQSAGDWLSQAARDLEQAEILVYTITEWRHLLNEKGAFSKVIKRDAKWIYRRSMTKA